MTLIKDPAWGTVARVGNHARLMVDAVSQIQEADAAHGGDAYIGSTPQAGIRSWTTATGNEYILMYLKNLSATDFLIISKFIMSVSAAGLVLYGIANPVEGTLANNTLVEPLNRNFGSSKTADSELHLWDEVGTAGITGLTGGEEFSSAILPASVLPFDQEATLHLARNNSVAVGVQNATGGNVEVAAAVRFFFEQIEELQP